jgi:hypothetical protein
MELGGETSEVEDHYEQRHQIALSSDKYIDLTYNINSKPHIVLTMCPTLSKLFKEQILTYPSKPSPSDTFCMNIFLIPPLPLAFHST